MRLVRITSDGHSVPPGIEDLVGRGRLDLLQLDFPRSRTAPAPRGPAVEFPHFSPGLAAAVQAVAKALFLEPQLRIMASAGWSDTYACTELTARALVEAGCGEIPVSAVRGSNLLPILDMLADGGVKLRHAQTHARWEDLGATVYAADLQIGAGPLAAALDEGARVVVAGHYDGSAPAVAAATRKFKWGWQDQGKLAAAACAARAAAWHGWLPSDPAELAGLGSAYPAPGVEIESEGDIVIEVPRPCAQAEARALSSWLNGDGDDDPLHLHADVRHDPSALAVEVDGPRQLRARGARGAATDKAWQLDILYRTGFVVETIIELSSGDARFCDQISAALQAIAADPDDPGDQITIQPLSGAGSAASWLHACCRSADWKVCNRFAELTAAFAGGHSSRMRLPAGRPLVQIECGYWPARIPRDAVDIAVDTRPAKEWQ